MKTPSISFEKTATIHRSPKFISIEALSGASALNYREDDGYRIYLEPDATDEMLGQVLLTALDRSRFVDPRSEREFFDPGRAARVYANWQKDFMRRYGYKTKRDAHSNLDWCFATVTEGRISIQPHRRDKPQFWKCLPPEKTVVIPATRDAAAVGAAVRLALARCE